MNSETHIPTLVHRFGSCCVVAASGFFRVQGETSGVERVYRDHHGGICGARLAAITSAWQHHRRANLPAVVAVPVP